LIFVLLNKVQNVEVSDTTEAEKSDTVCHKRISLT